MCIVFCLIIINISQFRKAQIRINFVSCYQPFSIYNGAVIRMFDVAVVDGYQIINIQVDSPFYAKIFAISEFHTLWVSCEILRILRKNIANSRYLIKCKKELQHCFQSMPFVTLALLICSIHV